MQDYSQKHPDASFRVWKTQKPITSGLSDGDSLTWR
jgi:hypothetical protein